MSRDMTLLDLLDLSIGTPQPGTVNFSALHALLHALLRQLAVCEVKVRFTDSNPGDAHTHAAVDVAGPGQQEGHAGAAPVSAAAEGQPEIQSRIRTCEDGVSEAMRLIQELHKQEDSLKDEMKELHHQQKMIVAQADILSAMETRCRCVDDLEETLRPLKDTLQRYPDPEELSLCVTWDMMQSALLPDRENVKATAVNSPDSRMSSSPHTINDTVETATPSSPVICGGILTFQEERSTGAATETPQHRLPGTGSVAAGVSQRWKSSHPERYSETVQALRNVGTLMGRFSRLEARVATLEEGKVDQTQLTQLRDAIADKGSQDMSENPMDQLIQQRALIGSLMSEQEKNMEVLDDVQKATLQLQAQCEKVQESSRCLQDNIRQTQNHIEDLYKLMDGLEEKKADKQMVESEIKADKCALDNKVSRLQFDSATEQLNTMFHELLNKVMGQEQDWHKVVAKLSTEMECKLNRIELDSVKKQLEDRWKKIHEKLQTQGAPEHEDAAGIRKQLVDRFHCLSCDRPVVKHIPGPHLLTLPSTPALPSHKSMRPFTVYALEHFRQHYRSERITELTDYGHLVMSRSCGGSHTVTSASQRRSGLQSMKQHGQPEVDGMIQSEEVDIIGLDGHIYRGRLNPAAIRTTETKLPTITTKDGMCRTNNKAKGSASHRLIASPEVRHNGPVHLPHGAQCSRSASSSSGRDWPVSALGCTSQSSITQRFADLHDSQQANL